MKKLILLTTIFIFYSITVLSQVTTVISGTSPNQPRDFVIVNDLLYYTIFVDSINYIDISQNNPNSTLLASGIDSPLGIEVKNDFIYFSMPFSGIISKINFMDSSPTITTVSSLGNTGSGIPTVSPFTLKFIGNELYFSDNNNNKIFKYNIISESLTTIVTLSSQDRPSGLEYKDGFLYYASYDGTINKIDITNPSATPIQVVSGLNRPAGLKFKGTELYIADATNFIPGDGRIVKIDVTQALPIIEDVLTNLYAPAVIDFVSDVMYFREFDRLAKIDLTTLSVNDFNLDEIVLYPNPSKDYLKISNIKNDISYSIYDINGRILKKGIVTKDSKINVSNLITGCYFIRFIGESSSTKKFVKN